jgi:AraC family transcriptional regulator
LPLTDIALACGFSSASHFSNRFKSTLGITPSQLRAAGQ